MANDFVEQYAKDVRAQGLTTGTILAYRLNIEKFMLFFNKKKITEIDKLDLRDYVAHMREDKGFTSNTLRYNLAAISSFYEWLIFEGLANSNPVLEVRKRYLKNYKNDGEKHTHQLISIEQASKMVKGCIDVRDRAILMVLFKTGIRRNEMLSLDIADIDFEAQSILLKPAKKRTNRRVFFDDECSRVLQRWIMIRKERADPNCKALFISAPNRRAAESLVQRLTIKAGFRAGVHDPKSDEMEKHFSAHCGRQWFTTHLRRNGMPREFIQELRGDKRRESDRYLRPH